jgi:MerR family transcriptional regulator, light-induced transcriptional regulator
VVAADSGSGGSASGPELDQVTIRQVAEILEMAAPTIRSWERRYGVPVADRSRGGHRRYSRDQLDQLRRMQQLVTEGRGAAEAAALVRAGYATSSAPLVEAFLQAARDLAPEGITQALEAAGQTLGLDRTVDEVLLPAMREVGEWWHTGRLDVAHEHLATNAARAWMSAVAPAGPLRSEPPVILCCGPRDHHTLGLEAIDALLRRRRWDCRLLGARTPVESLGRAIHETGAVAVVLSCHVTAGRAAAVDALFAAEPRDVHLFYGGGAFATQSARRGVPGHYLGDNLAQAADLVTDTITEGR